MSISAAQPPPRAVLAMVTALHFATHLFTTFLLPLNTELMAFFRLSGDAQVALIPVTYFLVYALGNLVAGFLAARYPPRMLLALGPSLNGLAVLAMAWLSPGQFNAMLVLMGLGAVGGGLYHPVANALLSETFHARKGRALGIAGFGASVAFVLGPWAASQLVHNGGWTWQHVVLLYGALGLLCGGLACLWIPPGRLAAPPLSPATGSTRLAAQRLWRAVFWFTILSVMVMAGRELAYWGSQAITRQHVDCTGGSRQWAGMLLALMNIPGLLVQPVAGQISDRIGRERVLGASLFCLAAALLILPYLSRTWVVISYVAAGAAVSATVPVFEALLADYTPAHLRGPVFGFGITATLVMGACGPWLAGWLADRGGNTPAAYHTVFLVLAGGALLSAFLSLGLRPIARALGLLPEPAQPAAARKTESELVADDL